MASVPPSEGTGSTSVPNPLPGTSRYELVAKIASGGMAMVYVGRLRGAAGFWRLCAIKRAHPHLVEDPDLRKSLIDEARLASRIRHPNVVAISDVEELEGELLLVMDYVEGAAVSDLLRHASDEGRTLSPRVVVRIVLDAAAGLAAAHDLRDEQGGSLGLVHRDVSPQNVLVGTDGIARIVDFGIAKCRDLGGISGKTMTGVLKGKVAYMSPEYVRGRTLDGRSDVFGLGVVLWEALTGQRLFRAETELDTMGRVTGAPAPPPSSVAPSLGEALDAVIARALEKSPARRFATMLAFANALEEAARGAKLVGTHAEVAAEVEALVGPLLERRRALVRQRMAAGGSAPGGAGEDDLAAGEDAVSVSVTLSDTARTLRADKAAGAIAQGGGDTRGSAPALVARRVALVAAIAGAVAVAIVAAVFSLRGSTPATTPVEVVPTVVPTDTAPEPASSSETSGRDESPVAPPSGARPRVTSSPPPRPRSAPASKKKETPDPNPYARPN